MSKWILDSGNSNLKLARQRGILKTKITPDRGLSGWYNVYFKIDFK